jgi:hypothetical protein
MSDDRSCDVDVILRSAVSRSENASETCAFTHPSWDDLLQSSAGATSRATLCTFQAVVAAGALMIGNGSRLMYPPSVCLIGS